MVLWERPAFMPCFQSQQGLQRCAMSACTQRAGWAQASREF